MAEIVLSVKERADKVEHPSKTLVVLSNCMQSVGEFQDHYRYCQQQRWYLAPVLYKDGRSSFVRMVDKNTSWRTDKSLKNYKPQQINEMLSLRGIEKAIIGYFGNPQYYQPESDRLAESLRTFRLETVNLDYSHIRSGDFGYGFVHNRPSIDYKLPEERARITEGAAKLMLRLPMNARIAAADIPADR